LKISILIFCLLVNLYSFADHIFGGEAYYIYKGNNNYELNFVIYRDCNSTGNNFSSEIEIGVFNKDLNIISTHTLPHIERVNLPVDFNNPCVTPPNNICIERIVYQSTINLPPVIGGYRLAYQRCCRGPSISNLISPESAGLTIMTQIPGSETGAQFNSSATFTNFPPFLLCNNDDLVFDHSAVDIDGDVLEYELVAPYTGGTTFNPAPTPFDYNPPFFPVIHANNFSPINPLGPGATINLDPNTGILTAEPELLGFFVVGIKVKEYRNGMLINEMIRDFVFRVINCIIELRADIVPQNEMTGITSFCEGFTITFENKSFGGTNYQWDFGVPGITTDVSTEFAPTYTYPEAGTYTVTLNINPGMPCSDVDVRTFNIYEKIDLSYSVIDSMCITNNSHDFNVVYDGPANPIFTWDFGPNANILSSNNTTVSGVVFDKSGYIPVSLSVTNGVCEETHVDSIFIFNVPELDFDIAPELMCAPYQAQFIDLTNSNARLIYLWEFGDGTQSSLKNPVHTYTNVGSYDVTLTIETIEGCLATLTMTKNNLITIFPSPTSKFSVNPTETSVFDPYFNVYTNP
jgi:PKD repeat protein